MNDITNSELKEVLVGFKDNNKEQIDSLKAFIQQTNLNVTKLNDNQIFHNTELTKLNSNLQIWSKLLNKYLPKIFWGFAILLSIILVMAGYSFLWDKLTVI